MITFAQIEAIEGKVSELPALIDHFESKDSQFNARAGIWLKSVEDALMKNRISQASEISLLRAELAINLRKSRNTSGQRSEKRLKKSDRDEITANIIMKAGDIVHGVLQSPKKLLEEGESIARQIAAVAVRKGLAEGMDGSWDKSTETWDTVFADPDLMSATTHLVGLIGRVNAIVIFSKAMSEV